MKAIAGHWQWLSSFMTKDADIIIVGAGAAGISAAVSLARAGMNITILEARNRIGGRIFTLHDSVCDPPIELGAEFIHGLPSETWSLLGSVNARITEVDGDTWCVQGGKLKTCDFFSEVDRILKKMDGRKRDQSFADFLKGCRATSKNKRTFREAKEWATSYVSGFNAADPAIVGVHWLVKGMRAEEKIEGDRAFRAEHGYADLINVFDKQLKESGITVRTSTIVERINWSKGQVEIDATGANGDEKVRASGVLVTVPLGVLQARDTELGAIRFNPELPAAKLEAIQNIMMGKVIRVTLRFSKRFWEDLPKNRKKNTKSMDGMSFLLSHDEWFPTWWTMSPRKLPLLVGWAPFHCAERLSGQSQSFVVDRALQALQRLTGVGMRELEGLLEYAYCHDWQSDPFSRGAYSYGKVGGDGAERKLAKPVQNTLFFAGEATDIGGHNGTVHGAIASGKRAAREIARSAGKNIRQSGFKK